MSLKTKTEVTPLLIAAGIVIALVLWSLHVGGQVQRAADEEAQRMFAPFRASK